MNCLLLKNSISSVERLSVWASLIQFCSFERKKREKLPLSMLKLTFMLHETNKCMLWPLLCHQKCDHYHCFVVKQKWKCGMSVYLCRIRRAIQTVLLIWIQFIWFCLLQSHRNECHQWLSSNHQYQCRFDCVTVLVTVNDVQNVYCYYDKYACNVLMDCASTQNIKWLSIMHLQVENLSYSIATRSSIWEIGGDWTA